MKYEFFNSSQMQQCTSGGIKVCSWLQDALSTLEVPQLIKQGELFPYCSPATSSGSLKEKHPH